MDTEKNNIEEAEDPSMEIFSVVRDLDALYHKWFELCAEEHEYRNHSLSRNALVKDLPDELFQKAEYYFQVAEDHRTIEKKEFIEGHYLMKDTVMPRTYEYLWVGFYYKLLDLVKQNSELDLDPLKHLLEKKGLSAITTYPEDLFDRIYDLYQEMNTFKGVNGSVPVYIQKLHKEFQNLFDYSEGELGGLN